MSLTLGALDSLMPTMSDWAMRGYPEEACGLIVEHRGALEAVCCENQQNRLHALDPVTYPRSANTAYSIDPLELVRAEGAGKALCGIFHSHPDRGAYFSEEDTLSALGGDPDGDPVLPGVAYLVLSARATGVDDARLFAWNAAARAFEEAP